MESSGVIVQIDPEVEKRVRDEVDRFAAILDVDAPPIAFEDASILGSSKHTSFRDGMVLITPQSVYDLSFDQLRTSIAFTMAVLVRINEMYRRTRTATWVGLILTVVVLVLATRLQIPGLAWGSMAVVGIWIAKGRKQRSWQRISETDKLALQLVGDIELVSQYIRTAGFRRDGVPMDAEMTKRRVAALRGL